MILIAAMSVRIVPKRGAYPLSKALENVYESYKRTIAGRTDIVSPNLCGMFA